MIRPSNDLDVVWLCRNAVDFRKGINGLSVLVEDQLVRDPFNGQLFVFVNRRRDKIKILPDYPAISSCGLIEAMEW